MREEKMLNLIGQVDCKYIEEANTVNQKRKSYWMKWCAVAACIGILGLGSVLGHTLYKNYNTEVSYICLDVNPSFELCLNHHNKVIKAIAYNEDGQNILNGLGFKNKDYQEVIHTIMCQDNFKQHLSSDLTFTIVSDNEEELRAGVENCMKSIQCSGNIKSADIATRELAQEHHCSVGKYVAYKELSQLDESVTIEECKEMTMHEIHERIDKCRSSHHEIENVEANDSHNSHHSGHHK